MSELLTTAHEVITRAILPAVFSWKSLALILAVINLKNLPFAWHVNQPPLPPPPQPAPPPDLPSLPNRPPPPTTKETTPTHPVFTPHVLHTHNSPWETDYNFHKSNSTYFSDLDISRTALVTRVYTPGFTLVSAQLDKELPHATQEAGRENAGKKVYIALGSTFCSFKREIKPLERFEVVSRVVAWDRKWVYVLSSFVGRRGRRGERVVFAAAVSKYVVKKGWLTISPERVLRASGFLPERTETEGEGEGEGVLVEQDEETETLEEISAGDGSEVGDKGKMEEVRQGNVGSWSKDDWTWGKIEEERLRGLKVVEGYAGLDDKLFSEWER
ncbi:hypothetical protein BO70DRAFT_430339 [Aspergillus heteromorphus CBS 117.55]|uniref:Thioesterase/thiol ester dehydrase-isomerase n=1 Tax=Aspergillus heteromorphus CBS 117.55 TaxID=1448321 RepID=A0A317VWK7_9EURO|nr:uncharacterized protein BO70DRAFT_430339 [Aspergillus heteromorphus CBS 117.55]PWY77397.1 hypothetical protein BO70DRAFT_430339 [Aspergillus heteromorphus CBS 117.55]